ncbi:MAG: tRNA (adenosine(37)-N6)-threonylcarbamoyltransferase complex dimerization subunit type 1 TsaB [Kiritimatiellales bacterium]|nr:tRNA (adenosine(37)-N6)-threonylcarbamoyltransferase complex dimerization subunit type 1 TsaB [Kiritimatiellales bacterium]
MKIFAIELSSKHGSIALVEDGEVCTEESWIENFKNRQQLFDSMAGLKVDWDTVDVFAAGRGPGAFSGMRIAFSVARSLAQPGGKPFYALNSAQALAAQVAQETGADRVAVVGDARRRQVWAGLFCAGELEKDFELMELDRLKDFIPDGTLVVSPDHDRLEELLSTFQTLEKAVSVFPTAGKLGQLVFQRLENGVGSEPDEPLYMHPPVFIEPRFPS